MIAATAFILAFIIVGATVLFFAFSAGGRRARSTRGSRRAFYTAMAVLTAVFGLAIPGYVIAHNNDEQSKQATGGLDLTEYQQDGRELFYRNCGSCHTLKAANAVGRVGPNLDELKGVNKGLVVNAIEVGRARGMGQMPAGLLTGEEVDKVATFVAAAAGR